MLAIEKTVFNLSFVLRSIKKRLDGVMMMVYIWSTLYLRRNPP